MDPRRAPQTWGSPCSGTCLSPRPYAGRAGSAFSNYLHSTLRTCTPFPHRQMVPSGHMPGHRPCPRSLNVAHSHPQPFQKKQAQGKDAGQARRGWDDGVPKVPLASQEQHPSPQAKGASSKRSCCPTLTAPLQGGWGQSGGLPSPCGETASERLGDLRLDTGVKRGSSQLQVYCSSRGWCCSGSTDHFGQSWPRTEILPSPKASFASFQPKPFAMPMPRSPLPSPHATPHTLRLVGSEKSIHQ